MSEEKVKRQLSFDSGIFGLQDVVLENRNTYLRSFQTFHVARVASM